MTNNRIYDKKLLSRLIMLLTLSALLLSACGNSSPTTEAADLVPTIAAEPSTTPIPPSPTPAPTETATTVPTSTPLPSGVWGEASSLGSARSEMPAVVLDGRIYVISGLKNGPLLPTQRTSEVYDIAGDEWHSMASLPEERHHGMAAAYDGKVYFFGGSPEASLAGMKEAWVYDPALDQWEEISPMPIHRSAGYAVVYNNFIYIMGGVGASHSHSEDEQEDKGETLRYDPATNEWTLLSAPGQRREHVTAAVIGDQIYVFGGRWVDAELTTSDIYDPATDTWKKGPDLPHPRAGNGIAVLNDLVYLIGGEIWVSGPEETLFSVDVYDPASNTWSSLPDLPFPLHGVPAVASGDRIYVIGGSTVAAMANNTKRLFVFKP